MAKQTISIGTTPNDGTGDSLRTTGQKVNENFTEVYDDIALKANIAADNITPATWRTALEVDSKADVDRRINARAHVGGVYFQKAGEAALAAGMMDFGTGDFTIVIDRLDLTDNSPATAGELLSTHSAGDNRLVISLLTTGVWRLAVTDDAAVTTNYDITPTHALVNGTPYSIALVAERDGDATLYVNGAANGTVDISAVSDIDIGSGNTNAGELLADANLSGIVSGLAPFNYTLSSAEVADLHTQGLQPWLAARPENMWGIMTELLENGTFDDTSEWSLTGATISGGQLTISTPENSSTIGNRATQTIEGQSNGNLLRLEYEVVSTSGSVGALWIQGTNFVTSGLVLGRLALNSLVGVHVKEFIVTGTGTNNSFTISVTGESAGEVVLDNLKLTRIGCLAAIPMTDGIGRHIADISSNGYHALASATGVTHLLPKKEGRIQRRQTNVSTSGVWIEASNILPANAVITSIVADGRRLTVLDSVAQDRTLRRIHIANTTNTLTFSRTSDTTAGTTLATGAVASAAACDITIEYVQNP
jgi:hypothetical protein